jgi:hypothetical protein
MMGDPGAPPLLLGLGVDELSMSPAQIPSAKQIIRKWSLGNAKKLAQGALDLDGAEAVRKAVEGTQFSNFVEVPNLHKVFGSVSLRATRSRARQSPVFGRLPRQKKRCLAMTQENYLT